MSNHFGVELRLGSQDPVVEPDYDNRAYRPQSGQQKFDDVVQALRNNQVDHAANLLRNDLLENPQEALRIARSLRDLSGRGQLPDSIGIGQTGNGRPDIQLNSQFGSLDIQESGVSRIAPPQPVAEAPGAPTGGYQPCDNSQPNPYQSYDNSQSSPYQSYDNSQSGSYPYDNSQPSPYQSYDAGAPQISFSLSLGRGGGQPFHGGCDVPHGYNHPRVAVISSHHEPPHGRRR